jgi:hypothetical protein
MLVADVFPGGCCGGSRYRPSPPVPVRGMMIVNHSGVPVCSVGSAADTGTPPRSYENLKEMHLAPGGSELVQFPGDAKFVLHVLSCDGQVLLLQPGLVPQDGIVTVEVGGSPPAPGGGGFATPP